jgi:hypothetical protein
MKSMPRRVLEYGRDRKRGEQEERNVKLHKL